MTIPASTSIISRPVRQPDEPFGDFRLRLEHWSQSPEGVAHDAEIAAANAREQAAERARQQREIVDRSGIPSRCADLFGSATPAPSEAIAALDLDRTLLILAGKSGCGKTTAAAWWLWQFIHGAVTPTRWPRFAHAGDLPRIDESHLLALRSAPRLVIDDLGMEYADNKGFFEVVLDRMLDWRYANLKPTVITTNLRAEQFKARYGERIADRIREAGNFVELSNESLRARSA